MLKASDLNPKCKTVYVLRNGHESYVYWFKTTLFIWSKDKVVKVR